MIHFSCIIYAIFGLDASVTDGIMNSSDKVSIWKSELLPVMSERKEKAISDTRCSQMSTDGRPTALEIKLLQDDVVVFLYLLYNLHARSHSSFYRGRSMYYKEMGKTPSSKRTSIDIRKM